MTDPDAAKTLIGRLVLICQADALLAFEIDEELARRGHRVAGPFQTLDEARCWLTGARPDFAIVDGDMRDGQAWLLGSELGALTIPWILLSSATPAMIEDRGVLRWLAKPVDIALLLRLVDAG